MLGRPGPPGRLGTRRGDRELVADAVATGRPLAAGAAAREAWCAMVVGGKAVGVLALRRGSGPPFTGEERAAVELLATGAGVAVDRLRFLRLWSSKLDQADAAHSQLLRYADDLRTTFTAERLRAEQLREALDAVQLAYIATVRALATAVEAKDAYTGGHLSRVTAYGTEACRALGGDLAVTEGLEYAFLLHDLGKIGVPDAVLNKAGPLTDEEWALMREHPAIGLLVHVTLEGDDYEILEAADGLEALEVARGESPRLVLLDIMMPRLDGLEVCRQLKSDPETNDIVVVMLTAQAQDRDRDQGLAAGADDYFTKPFSPLALLNMVERVRQTQSQAG
ncbi:MAG TPA: response regulator [Actinomycetes bacterium]|nr:response regulator [Actinomycetes bacterium]